MGQNKNRAAECTNSEQKEGCFLPYLEMEKREQGVQDIKPVMCTMFQGRNTHSGGGNRPQDPKGHLRGSLG